MLKRTEPVDAEAVMTKAIAEAATELKAGNISAREAIRRLGDAIEESFGPMEPEEVLRLAGEEMKDNVVPLK